MSKYKFTLVTATLLGVLTTIFPDKNCLIDCESISDFPKANKFMNNYQLLKSIRHALAHKTERNFSCLSLDRQIEKIVLESNFYESIAYNFEELEKILLLLEQQLICEYDFFSRIIEDISLLKGMEVIKPLTSIQSIKGLGNRRNEEALIYYIPSKTKGKRPNEKGVNRSEFNLAYRLLYTNKYLDRKMYEEYLPGCKSEGGCNFTTIGGIFEYYKVAVYEGSRYKYIGI